MSSQYVLNSIPNDYSFAALSTVSAKFCANRFVDSISERVLLLQSLVQEDLRGWTANYSTDSLSQLGQWLPHQVMMIRRDNKRHDDSGLDEVGIWIPAIPTDRSFSIGLDVATYIGECVRCTKGGLSWKLAKSSRRSGSYQQPVLSSQAAKGGYSPFNWTPRIVGSAYVERHGRNLDDAPPDLKGLLARMPVVPVRDVILNLYAQLSDQL